MTGNVGILLERLWERFGLNLIGHLNWDKSASFLKEQDLVTSVSLPISFIRLQRKKKICLCFPIFTIPHAYSYKTLLHFRSLFYFFHKSLYPFHLSPCEATFYQLFYHCLFLASSTSCKSSTFTQSSVPFVSILSLEFTSLNSSHYLSLLCAQGPQTCHFTHSPVTRAFSRDKN